jgi:hypothetical protein
MSLSVESIIAKFPIKSLPVITGEPDYALVNDMMQDLYTNAASLPTTLGGGQHGHIGIVMSPILYATISAVPYNQPVDPGPEPLFAANASQATKDNRRTQHKQERRIFDHATNMEDALKAQVIDAVESTYLCEMRNKYTGYLGISTRDLLDHLLDRYGKITSADITKCKQRMEEPLDSTEPIDVYFQKIDACVQYAADGRVAFTPDQIIQTGYNAISTSGFYHDACKEWRRKPVGDKTWLNFKRFFASEYHDLKEQQRENTSQSNFHGANAAVDITMALDNLALAATNDRDSVTLLTSANQQLTAAVKSLTEQLKQALATNAVLASQIGQNNTPNGPTNTGRKPFDRAAWEASLDPNGYCWTHGYKVTSIHTSASCKGKLGGHCDTATRANNMGGSQRGKPSA